MKTRSGSLGSAELSCCKCRSQPSKVFHFATSICGLYYDAIYRISRAISLQFYVDFGDCYFVRNLT
jgi:hypothetical protein